ncbi:Nramp family divalent metal transporter [Chitinophaga sp.]|uniref:Nramp family divalent metal transporter n=1 Tax=Chitinophaga sp. TaxID=1869181 RepID=UPI0031E46EDD
MRSIKQPFAITKWARQIIPGIITAAIVFGPSKITITSKMGASYGYDLLWVVAAAILFMIVYTGMATRIAQATDVSLLATIRRKWGSWASITVGVGIFLVTTSFQAGNAIGTGIAVAEMTQTPADWWVLVFTILALSLLFFRAFYHILEKLMIALVVLMLLAFCATLTVIRPGGEDILGGFVPHIPDGSIGLVIAFTASCFSLVAAFYQAYLVQEQKKQGLPLSGGSARSAIPGILLLGLLVLIVMLCAGTALYSRGVSVSSAMDMASALEPLFGPYAAHLFLAGLFGASFSSLVGNATLGGTMLADALYNESGLESPKVRWSIAFIMIAGAAIAIVFGRVPLQAIVIAQSLTIFIVPVIGAGLLLLANDKAVMSNSANSFIQNALGFAGLAILIILAIVNARQLFF